MTQRQALEEDATNPHLTTDPPDEGGGGLEGKRGKENEADCDVYVEKFNKNLCHIGFVCFTSTEGKQSNVESEGQGSCPTDIKRPALL